MVKTSHNKTIRIESAGTYQINSDNEIIVINTTGAVIITMPHLLKDNDRINIISVVAAPNVTVTGVATLTTAYGYLQVEYNTSANTYVSRQLVSTGVVGDTGWTLDDPIVRLNDSLGVAVENTVITTEGPEYVSLIDTSAGDVTEDLTTVEAYLNVFKFIKVSGPNNLILQSTQGFSDGSTELVVTDSCLLFNDPLAITWQILYNTDGVKTEIVEISSAEILTIGTTPITLLPAPGAGKYYDIESIIEEFTFGTIQYSLAGDTLEITNGGFIWQNTSVILAEENVAAILVRTDNKDIVKMNQAVFISTTGGDDPTLGDGTLRIILKYKLKTFGA